MAADEDYRANQQDCKKRWQKKHPDYWRNYRARRRQYCQTNRQLQRLRDLRRRLRHLAKMDALGRLCSFKAGTYYLVPCLAKMDASVQKVIVIPRC
jgi:hypothetical protein